MAQLRSSPHVVSRSSLTGQRSQSLTTDSVPDDPVSASGGADPALEVANPAPEVANPAPEVANPAPEVGNLAPEVTNPAPEVANSAPEVANPTAGGKDAQPTTGMGEPPGGGSEEAMVTDNPTG